MSKDDGGPAFPHPYQHGVLPASTGMTLRDWFAGQAIPGIIAACFHDQCEPGETRAEMFARKSYLMADALLTARDAQ